MWEGRGASGCVGVMVIVCVCVCVCVGVVCVDGCVGRYLSVCVCGGCNVACSVCVFVVARR